MNVFPIHAETAAKKHWIVRWLRYTGYLEIIAAVLVGLFYSYNLLTPMFYMATQADPTICAVVALVLGGFISFVAGLAITLPVWALSMLLDDIHVMRLNSQGYVVMDGRQGE